MQSYMRILKLKYSLLNVLCVYRRNIGILDFCLVFLKTLLPNYFEIIFKKNVITVTLLTTCKTWKADGIKTIFRNRLKSRLYDKVWIKTHLCNTIQGLNKIAFRPELNLQTHHKKYNDDMCKQALCLVPASLACTPNYYSNDEIRNFKEIWSTHDNGYILL